MRRKVLIAQSGTPSLGEFKDITRGTRVRAEAYSSAADDVVLSCQLGAAVLFTGAIPLEAAAGARVATGGGMPHLFDVQALVDGTLDISVIGSPAGTYDLVVEIE